VVAVATHSATMLLGIMTIAISGWISNFDSAFASSVQAVPLGLRTNCCESHRHTQWSSDDSRTSTCPTPSSVVLENALVITLAMSKLFLSFNFEHLTKDEIEHFVLPSQLGH
jgi:hypothetical protein